jgi:hypothetical protein
MSESTEYLQNVVHVESGKHFRIQFGEFVEVCGSDSAYMSWLACGVRSHPGEEAFNRHDGCLKNSDFTARFNTVDGLNKGKWKIS